jgi:hypothetical protein
MGEFDKNQDKGNQTGQQQGDKPAFGQLNDEKGQGQQEQQDIGQKGETLGQDRQQEQGSGKQEELTGQQGDNQFKTDQGRGSQDS